MKCKKAGILISALADGELSASEQPALEKHISACPACAREMEAISELRRGMSLWADETPSEWLAQNFSHKLRELADEGCVPVRQKARLRWGVLGPAT
ncbi:MAG: zf-HC2 domain-containing protein, partial [Armatimonadetes bacterium]|nr:zf-HC2 domain-containing protein [Armatimonadota bacterium]